MPSPTDHGEPWTLMEKTRKSDGMGGYFTTYTDGITFTGLPSVDSSATAFLAEQQAGFIRMSLFVDKNIPLENLDYLRRDKRENEYYQIRSDPDAEATPEFSPMDTKVFSIVKTELPK